MRLRVFILVLILGLPVFVGGEELAGVSWQGSSVFVERARLQDLSFELPPAVHNEEQLGRFVAAVVAGDERIIGAGVEVAPGRDIAVLAVRREARVLGVFRKEYRLILLADKEGSLRILSPWWLVVTIDDRASVSREAALRLSDRQSTDAFSWRAERLCALVLATGGECK